MYTDIPPIATALCVTVTYDVKSIGVASYMAMGHVPLPLDSQLFFSDHFTDELTLHIRLLVYCGCLSSKKIFRPIALLLFLREFHNIFVCDP